MIRQVLHPLRAVAVAAVAFLITLGLMAPAQAGAKVLPPVRNLTATEITADGATISWQAPSGRAKVEGYAVVWKGAGTSGKTYVAAPKTSVRLTLPAAPGTYTVGVTPAYANKLNGQTTTVTFTKPTVPQCAPSGGTTGTSVPAKPVALSVYDLFNDELKRTTGTQPTQTLAAGVSSYVVARGAAYALIGSDLVRFDAAGSRTVLTVTGAVVGMQKDAAGNVYVQTDKGIWKVASDTLVTQLYACNTAARMAVSTEGLVTMWAYDSTTSTFTFSVLKNGALTDARQVKNPSVRNEAVLAGRDGGLYIALNAGGGTSYVSWYYLAPGSTTLVGLDTRLAEKVATVGDDGLFYLAETVNICFGMSEHNGSCIADRRVPRILRFTGSTAVEVPVTGFVKPRYDAAMSVSATGSMYVLTARDFQSSLVTYAPTGGAPTPVPVTVSSLFDVG